MTTTNVHDEYRAALAILRALAHDFTDEGERLFAKWLRICQELKDTLIQDESHRGWVHPT